MIGFEPGDTAGGLPPEPAPPRRRIIGRVIFLFITGVCLYIFAPKISEVFTAWSRLGDVHPLWMVPAIACAVASFGCMWGVQALALGSRDWFSIINTQLAGNAFNRITPGGGATGTALQANMLTSAGIDGACAATAIAVQSLMSTAALVALPLFTLPFIIFGTQIPSGLLSTLWIGIAAFLVMGVIGTSVFVFDGPLRWLGTRDRDRSSLAQAQQRVRRDDRHAPGRDPQFDSSRDRPALAASNTLSRSGTA